MGLTWFSDPAAGPLPEPSVVSPVITCLQGSVKTRFADSSEYPDPGSPDPGSNEPFGPASATGGQKREEVMNHSMYSADRATHLKIVVLGLLCATVVAVVGIFANVSSGVNLGTDVVVKAGQPTTLSGHFPTIR